MGGREHGRRGTRGWKKLHLGVARSGEIVAHTWTEATGDHATRGIDLITQVNGDLAIVTADVVVLWSLDVTADRSFRTGDVARPSAMRRRNSQVLDRNGAP